MMGGKEVSRVSYGTMQLLKLKDESKARKVICKAYELGVNHFDTVDFYEDGFTNKCLADEIDMEQDVVIVTKAATCTLAGIKTYTCTACGSKKTETIPASGHKSVTDAAVAAAVFKAGKTAGTHYSVFRSYGFLLLQRCWPEFASLD